MSFAEFCYEECLLLNVFTRNVIHLSVVLLSNIKLDAILAIVM